ncbi:biotin transporter BioY [Roseisalinus antarcticus]|uniref:Biotin transporter n=1 Tax=Roseisalinus antarcticus TaxID=254357 RepID=A0A1Y5T422_9RHOB|nr:biotin transporter BioY [Roseisalinus antarcticus]SLN54864.1 Biotin transporter BioY [Roseisalinus antarcticus]
MALTMTDKVLSEAIGPGEGMGRVAKQVILVALGVAAMVVAANIRVPMWPVPITMQTFAVLTIGATYGAGLGFATIAVYLALGALGFQVFTGEGAGLTYMMGATGGYLVGFAVAAGVMGVLARRGWDRSVTGMVGALLIGNAVIYAFGLPWMAYLFLAERGADFVLQWGMTNFLLGDALKLVLAALVIPGLWKLLGNART